MQIYGAYNSNRVNGELQHKDELYSLYRLISLNCHDLLRRSDATSLYFFRNKQTA